MIAGLGSGGYPPCRSLPFIRAAVADRPRNHPASHCRSICNPRLLRPRLLARILVMSVFTPAAWPRLPATLLGARAFALGNHLCVRAWTVSLSAQTEGYRRLLAHELASTSPEQRRASGPPRPLRKRKPRPWLSRMPGLSCSHASPDSLPSVLSPIPDSAQRSRDCSVSSD